MVSFLMYEATQLRALPLQCESKKSPPEVLWQFFQKGWEFLDQILLAYYAFLSTLGYEFLLSYLQL